MKHLIWPVLLASLLAGCSATPSKDALIEDRGVKAEPVKAVDAAKPVEPAKAADTKPVDTRSADTKSAEVKPTEARKAEAPRVQTQALATAVTEVRPLQVNQGGVAGTAQANNAALASPLRDPANPLSRRRLSYDYDSAAIKTEFSAVLEAHANYLKGNKSANLILQGHADERGSREYNLALGQRRAEGVSKALQLLGVPDSQVEAVSLGEEKPLAEGHDEEAWRQNRRVEILYQGE